LNFERKFASLQPQTQFVMLPEPHDADPAGDANFSGDAACESEDAGCPPTDPDSLQTRAPSENRSPSENKGASTATSYRSSSNAVLDGFVAGSQFGQFIIERRLGRGAMGVVYQVRHIKLHKFMAIKILLPEWTCDLHRVKRFEREMRMLAMIEHPSVVAALDAGEVDGVHYLAMEYVDGVTLQEFVRTNGPCSVPQACSFIADTASALAVAHERGMVHRDVKPSNILLTQDGRIKLADLGLAKLRTNESSDRDSGSRAESPLTEKYVVVGTAEYMAPEQYSSPEEVDGRADLYALGCTLHYLLHGKTPFAIDGTRSSSKILRRHMCETPGPLARSRSDVPQELDAIYQNLLSKLPEERTITAAELAEQLKRFSPVATAPARNASADAPSWFRRAMVALLAVTIVSALTFVAYGAWKKVAGLNKLAGSSSVDGQRPVNTDIQVIALRRFNGVIEGTSYVVGRDVNSVDLSNDYLDSLAKIQVRFEQPRYAFLIALNPTNDPEYQVQLLHPSDSNLAPELSDGLEVPSGNTYYDFSDGDGQQVFLVVESVKPLPSFDRWRPLVSNALAWRPVNENNVWFISDTNIRPSVPSFDPRGKEVHLAPQQLEDMLVNLRDVLSKDTHLHGIAFPIRRRHE
jgi:hypothetical protein